ncbi:MAG: choice-of-anchor D domain-containing protein, partial [Calditrichaeota bacterium]|nr:choice-of-anchor D domain-containing protein [Calditrichota bacterium]
MRKLNIITFLQVFYLLTFLTSTAIANASGFVYSVEMNPVENPRRDDRGGEVGQEYNWLDDDEDNGPDFEWMEISNIGDRLEAEDDWNSGPIDLGWSFEFYGEAFESINICSNGWASFTSDTNTYIPFQLPTEREPFNILAVQWVDLNPEAGGSVYFWTDPDEEIAIVSWIGIPVWGAGDQSEQTFQLIINGNGSIVFQYADGHETERLTCVGIQNSDGSDGLNISFSREDACEAGRAYGIGYPWIEYPGEAGIYIEPDAIDFGVVLIDTFTTDSLIIVNIGSETLVIDSILTDNDVFTILDFENEESVESGASWSFRTRFEPEEIGRVDDNVVIYCNAVNSDDGRVMIHLTGIGRGVTMIGVEPREIVDELNSTESSQHEISVRNEGDAALEFRTLLSAISTPNQGVPWNGNIETRYALFAETDPWGFNLEDIFHTIDGLDYTRYSGAEPFDDVDLSDYDAVWIGNNQSNDWIANYNHNIDKFEEFVDSGGIYYMCTASSNLDEAPVHPGGLIRRSMYFENYGLTQLPPDENYLLGYMDWDEDTRLRGGPFCLTGYGENTLENIENSGSYEILVSGQDNGIPIVVTYRYGSGICIVSGTTDGRMHDDPDQYPWGRTGEGMLRYMDFLYNLNRWITWSPRDAVIEPEQDTTLTITLEARNYLDGDYSSELHILSNADNEPDIAITVDLHIIGVPEIEVTWIDEIGYPDSVNWNSVYPDLLNDADYEIVLTLMNRGSADLQIDGFDINHDAFSVNEDGFELQPGVDTVITVTFSPIESDEYQAVLIINSDDPDEGEFEITLYASS